VTGESIVDDDLRFFAPDLLMWYVPQLRWGVRYALGGNGLVATVGHFGLELGTGPAANVLPAYQWDVRRTAELRQRCGGGARTPFFTRDGRRLLGGDGPEAVTERALALHDAGRAADAWTAAGFDLRVLLFEPEWGPVKTGPAALAGDERARRVEVDKVLAGLRPVHATLATPRDEPVRLEWPGRCLVVDRPPGARPRVRLVPMPRRGHRPPGRDAVERSEFGRLIAEIPLVRADRVRCPPEFAGLLDGSLGRADLHPLVQVALFPDAEPLAPPPFPRLRDRVQVPCGGAIHEVVMRDGALHTPHTREELDRERMLAALGGRVQGCAAAVEGWRDPRIRMPKRMRALRDSVLDLIRRGDPGELAAALDHGLDPHLRDGTGSTLLHHLYRLPGTDLLPRLLAAGLDPTVVTFSGQTPAERAESLRRPDLARALTEAGLAAGHQAGSEDFGHVLARRRLGSGEFPER
jgi:hypothetical protein